MFYFNFNNLKHSVGKISTSYVHFELYIIVRVSFCGATRY